MADKAKRGIHPKGEVPNSKLQAPGKPQIANMNEFFSFSEMAIDVASTANRKIEQEIVSNRNVLVRAREPQPRLLLVFPRLLFRAVPSHRWKTKAGECCRCR